MRQGLSDALRLTFFLRVAEGRPSGRWGSILALVVAAIVIPQLIPLWDIGLDGELRIYSLPSAFLHVALLLVAAVAAALLVGKEGEVPRIFMAGLMVSTVLDVFGMVFDLAGINTRVLAQLLWIPPVWLAMAMGLYAARMKEPGARRLSAMLACLALLAYPLASTWRDRTLWAEPYDPGNSAAAGAQAATSEAVFYRQPELLWDALEDVKPGTPGVIDVFFIGMAGFGQQDVFRKEVDSVAKIMADRFGAGGHSIRLVNNSRSLMDAPIASVTSLRESLARMAEVMDREEDVLVLFMTSHGSEDHKFSLTLWPWRFDDLDPSVLRGLLDESGIRNRVVIVSACYSGGFVKPLENADTLVITAAAADKTSFGCSNEAEWTYFGKAYFDESLRNTRSFVKAFAAAKPRVEQRELAEHFDPSQPQISVGTGIATRLDALEAQLEKRAHP